MNSAKVMQCCCIRSTSKADELAVAHSRYRPAQLWLSAGLRAQIECTGSTATQNANPSASGGGGSSQKQLNVEGAEGDPPKPSGEPSRASTDTPRERADSLKTVSVGRGSAPGAEGAGGTQKRAGWWGQAQVNIYQTFACCPNFHRSPRRVD